MTLSTPLLAAAPLIAGLMGPAIVGAAPSEPHVESRPIVRSAAQERTPPVADIVERVATRSAADQRRVLAYWTPERMAAALPIKLLDELHKTLDGDGLLSGLSNRTGLGAAPELANGVTKVTPRRQSARPQTTTFGSRWVTGGAVAKTTGRVFLTLDGVDFVCSAGTVKSANKDVVVTAGHCVKDGRGVWAENWTFVPGYIEGGDRPYGTFTARRMFVAGPWSRSADDSYDIAMVALNKYGGKHVADAVGTQDIAFNAGRGGQVFGFGYPADPPYDGERLIYCAGRVRDDPHGATRDQGLGCDMTAGSSGGPWMSGFNASTGRGTVMSVSSFKYSDDRETMYGPYFGDAAKALFGTAERA
ncbi:trypsin-like serine peptidase [Nonomuraea sp. NPDC050663]|uniref:trypsin-like serine peptidase n=1 Tax=Nonomuraea sp. NPDC050663 TaxID=3364370 RepID=UPI0037B7A8B6